MTAAERLCIAISYFFRGDETSNEVPLLFATPVEIQTRRAEPESEEFEKEKCFFPRQELRSGMDKPWFLYFIECRNGSIYTGITTDVARRFEEHVAGKGAKYTRMNPPVQLLGVVAYENRGAALSAEIRMKKMPAELKRAWIAQLGRATKNTSAADSCAKEVGIPAKGD
jgi:putative endonuclease